MQSAIDDRGILLSLLAMLVSKGYLIITDDGKYVVKE